MNYKTWDKKIKQTIQGEDLRIRLAEVFKLDLRMVEGFKLNPVFKEDKIQKHKN